jgi:RNA polymerase sigma-70 factor, ECF subfamily
MVQSPERGVEMADVESRVSGLLRQWSGGDDQALEQLVPIVYKELRRLAHYHLGRERDGHSLETTALVHEVYLRLCDQDDPRWEDRAHFFAVAARLMRRILVDYSRRRGAEKRGAGAVHIPLDDALILPVPVQFDLIELDGALEQLAAVHPRKYQVVEMRFFAGLGAKEIAAVLKTTEATVRRDWIIAKGWLFRYLEEHAKA